MSRRHPERAGSQREETDEERLAQWVRAVVQRWTRAGISARDRTRLFASLLHELVAARVRPTGIGRIVDIAPEIYADRLRSAHMVGPPTSAVP